MQNTFKLNTCLAITAVAMMTGAGSAFAESVFQGAYVQGGLGYSNTDYSKAVSNEILNGSINLTLNTSVKKANDLVGAITVGYMKQINDHFLLGIGAEYLPFSGEGVSATSVGMVTQNSTVKNGKTYNIFLSPAYLLDEDKLVYAKLGYTNTTVKVTLAGSNNPSTDFNGLSLGLGYKQVLKGAVYAFAEGNYYKYDKEAIKASGTVLSGVGVGMKYTSSTPLEADVFNVLVGVGYNF